MLSWKFFPSDHQVSDSIRRKIHLIGIAFTRIWIDFLSCSHVTGYDSYPDKPCADRPCVHNYPSLSYLDRLFKPVSARRIFTGSEAHNMVACQIRSVSLYHVVENSAANSCALTNQLSSVFSTIFVITEQLFFT